jgi:hypothetical protein
MIYTVECDLATPDRVLDWDEWYMHHVHKLLGVPGIRAAQRFRTLLRWRSPYLAIYSIDSADVMDSPAYRGRGGRTSTGHWQPLMINWHRNLFEGIGIVPSVKATELLLVTEAPATDVAGSGVEFTWLENTGLDRSMGRRGIAICEAGAGERAAGASSGRIRAYRPMMDRLVSPHGLV